MLIALSIRDFVLVRSLDLEFPDGFSALTGETGAGKSIMLSALGFALGASARSGPASGLVRAGATRALVSASFEPPSEHPVWRALETHGVEASPDDILVLKRVVKRGGAARGFINDQTVSARLLEEIGAHLVEVHGQHASHALMDPARHGPLLDAFCELDPQLKACAAAWRTWRSAIDARAALDARRNRRAEDLDYLTHALEEIDILDPQTGEADQLAAERAYLQSEEQSAAALSEALAVFGRNGVEAQLASAAKALNRAVGSPAIAHAPVDAELPRKLHQACEALERALIEAYEATSAVNAAQAEISLSPDVLERVEARLFALRALARKHDADPNHLPRLRETIALQLAEIESADISAANAAAAERAARNAYDAAAEDLSERRAVGAAKLEKAVARELKPLKLGRAKFRVSLTRKPLGAAGPAGWDEIAFEIATNVGSDFGPLDKIASGGELARFALALKVCLARSGDAQTLIFDEADVGVGGATAAAVGARLRRLARDRQVLAITHSPQVAAAADAQWRISKSDKAGAAETRVVDLAPDDRLEEIARMLAGAEITAEARAAADRLLALR
ncbi:MAG: DNA repair protein RecN [Pseudomonadota bacterium]